MYICTSEHNRNQSPHPPKTHTQRERESNNLCHFFHPMPAPQYVSLHHHFCVTRQGNLNMHRHTLTQRKIHIQHCTQSHTTLYTVTHDTVHSHTRHCTQSHTTLYTVTHNTVHSHTRHCTQSHTTLHTVTHDTVHSHTRHCTQSHTTLYTVTHDTVHSHTRHCTQSHTTLYTVTHDTVHCHTQYCIQQQRYTANKLYKKTLLKKTYL